MQHRRLSTPFTAVEFQYLMPFFMVLSTAVPILQLSLWNKKILEIDTQLCLIPSGALWSIDLNDRTHRYPHKVIDLLLLYAGYDTGYEQDILSVDIKIGWNYAQPCSDILPHYYHSRIMPPVYGSVYEGLLLCKRVALMRMTRQARSI